jgi:hypothetical protein
MSSSNQSGKKKWEDGLQEQNRQFDTQEIQELFQEINLERPPKRRKLLRDILLEPASETEGLNSGHSLPCKRAREGPNIESSSISASHLVPIGVVGFDPLSSHPTILFCDDLFHSDSGLKFLHPMDQLKVFERTRTGPPFIFGLCGGALSIPEHSDQCRGFIAFDSHSNLGQLVPWTRRTLDCQIRTYIDEFSILFRDIAGSKRVKQNDLNSN